MNTADNRYVTRRHPVHPVHPVLRAGSLCAISAVLSICAATAMAVAQTPAAEIQSRYEQERARCLDGTSNQDRATCLKEAGAARDEARKGNLNDGDAKYRRNARVRCEALSGDEARDCLARMKGKGTTSGSAESGGILRETVTRETKPVETVPAAVPAAAPAASAN
jgi:hypothetical protein